LKDSQLKITQPLAGVIQNHGRLFGKQAWDELVKATLLRLRAIATKLTSVPPGLVRIEYVHNGIDLAVKRAKEAPSWKASCGKGCSHCCHTQVFIGRDEAQLLAHLIKTGSASADVRHIKRMARGDYTDGEWFRLPDDQRRCPFLTKEGECGVYDSRPAACRKYFVTNDPEQCRVLGGKATVNVVTEAEEVTSAYYSLTQARPMHKALMPFLKDVR
jgi:Fe-S-cluster containining protein